jgi:hypothetical protein
MGTGRCKYYFLDFLNDGIWALKRLIPMYAAVIVMVYIWALYNPQIKATLLEVQNIIFWWI